jgi:hypothetical protein
MDSGAQVTGNAGACVREPPLSAADCWGNVGADPHAALSARP